MRLLVLMLLCSAAFGAGGQVVTKCLAGWLEVAAAAKRLSPAELLSLQKRQQNSREIERQLSKVFSQVALFQRPYPFPAQDEAGKLVPADPTTGDLYSAVTAPDGRVSIFLGDAEGHGNVAARTAAAFQNFIRRPEFVEQAYANNASASDVLKWLDTHMDTEESADRSLCLGHILIDPKTGKMQYANAGVPFVRIRKANGEVKVLQSAGLYIGNGYTEYAKRITTAEYQLDPGDTIVFYTDGVTDPRGIRFSSALETGFKVKVGDRKLDDDALDNRLRSLTPEEATSASTIRKALLSPWEQSIDDSTMLVLRWDGPKT
jgi:serine phosphatase RsbU (regulator of sigma subunit)